MIVWQKAMTLARSVYVASEALPKREAYGLVSQIRRAAISVPSNIAEGHGRLTDLQFRHFLGNARGSLNELQTQLELASGLGYLDAAIVQSLVNQCAEVARLTNGLIVSMNKMNVEVNINSANSASTANSALRMSRP